MNAREFVLDLPTKYRRTFERTSSRDLAIAQTAGIIDAFRDQVAAGTLLSYEARRATWMRALDIVTRHAV